MKSPAALQKEKLSGHLITLPKEVWEIISLIAIIVIPILGEAHRCHNTGKT